MASSHDGTCPRDLLQGLVAGASPLECAARPFYVGFPRATSKAQTYTKTLVDKTS